MSFTNKLVHTVTISRLGATTGIKSAYSTVASYSTIIQPLDDQSAQQQGLAFGRAFKAFFDLADNVAIRDKAVDNYGTEYRVQGIKFFKYGNYPHIEAVLVIEDK